MADEKKQIPGVRLEHRGSKIFERAGKKSVEMTVVAQINDEEVWKEVEGKFIAGFDVFTIEDFKGEMIQAMRSENGELEAKIRVLENELARRRREVELLEGRLEDAQRPLRELGKRLAGG